MSDAITQSNSESLNSTLANMTRDDLESELVHLKSTNNSLTKQVEQLEQNLYELKRQLSTSKAMEEHLSNEIETLQNSDDSNAEKSSKKISALEEEMRLLKKDKSNTAQQYELELQRKELEIQQLTESLKTDQNETNKTGSNNEDIEKYSDEIIDLKLKNEELLILLSESEQKYNDICAKNMSLDNRNTELSNDLQELRDCLESTKSELRESAELARNLQDDMIIMQMEIDKYKSVPLETAAKGNSLFAEVDDNRLKLQKHIQTMNKKYLDMKLKYSNKTQELQKLHLEYSALIKVIENKNDTAEDQCELVESYKRHYENLTESIKKLENEIELQKRAYSNIMSGDMKCAQELISVTRNEVLTLQQKLNSESLSLTFSEQARYNAKKELKYWQSEALQLRAKVLELTQRLEEMKLLKSPPPIDNEITSSTKSFAPKTEVTHLPNNSYFADKKTSLYTQIEDWDEDCLPKISEEKSVNNCVIPENGSSDMSMLEKELGSMNLENKENQTDETNKCNANLQPAVKNKKVSFTQDTVEPKTGKAGRKVMTIRPVYIPSIKKC